jgi:hypothetical protein
MMLPPLGPADLFDAARMHRQFTALHPLPFFSHALLSSVTNTSAAQA